MLKPLFVGVMLFSTVQAHASVSDCKSALILSTYNASSSAFSDTQLAQYVSSSEYEKAKHDGGANAVIYGVPVGATYGDFQERARQQASGSSSSITQNQFSNILWTGLGSSGAYADCLKAEINQAPGLHLNVVGATQQDVTVELRYVKSGNIGPDSLRVQWDPSKVVGALLPSQAMSGGRRIRFLRPKSEMEISVNAVPSGLSDSVVLTPLPKYIPFSDLRSASKITVGGYYGYDASQDLMRSSTVNGGPSENFSVAFQIPRAGYYRIEALWTAGGPTEVYVFQPGSLRGGAANGCQGPTDMTGVPHFLPPVGTGWSASDLPSVPDVVVSRMLLPAGPVRLIFSSMPCGGGMGGGRIPSTRYVRLLEQ
jgi:hypothetical protein